jgi:hypothetical protein
METFNDNHKHLAWFFTLALIITSCIPDGEFLGDAGQTLVKLFPAEYNKVLLAPVATSQTIAVIEVRRDVAGQAAFNSTSTAVLKFDKDTAMIKQFNSLNGTLFTLLPGTLYTSDPAPAADGTVTVNFSPGDFVRSIMITVPDVFKFDFSQKYALAYKLESVSGTGIKSLASSDTTIIEIGAMNEYEGWYHSVGFRDHPTAGVFPVDGDKYLSTVDQYTVETYTGDYMYYSLLITIDPHAPLTNNVTIMSWDIVLFDNDPTVNARGITGGYNHYDPVNRIYYLYYYYNSSAPRVIQETITKK